MDIINLCLVCLSQSRDKTLAETIFGKSQNRRNKMSNQTIAEKLLQLAMNKGVSEKLNEVIRQVKDLAKGMSEAEQLEAAPMILDMAKKATDDFFAKMQARLESKKV